MNLNYNLDFTSLYTRDGLIKIDQLFLDLLKNTNPDLYEKLTQIRISKCDDSSLIIAISPYLEEFIAKLFDVESEISQLKSEHDQLGNLYRCKRLFIQRRALKSYPKDKIQDDFANCYNFTTELSFANDIMKLLENEESNYDRLDLAAKYAAWYVFNKRDEDSILFSIPKKTDYDNLIELEKYQHNGIDILKSQKTHIRDGFNLTSKEITLDKALDQANYCIFCHVQHKDACSKGAKEKKNPLEIDLIGCPLEEKISEMNYLKSKGCSIGALAVAMIDNPLLAATGDRICNECMRSCIYQKQQPVDIPKIESRVLKDILDLTWGFEIYSLLSRWNPLNFTRHLPRENTGYKILVAGLGPAGFNLAHHLLNDGHMVVAIDGLKIEPLPEEISGISHDGDRVLFKPIKYVKDLFEDLEDRISYGFGGVAEYGITVRWNKNYLKIIRLLLERRKNFAMYGGVRFGGAIDYDIARELGFDHIALAIGAGKPNLPSMGNLMCKGMRTASDFLMSLQLGSAHRQKSLTNLQIRLPVIVIGAGLTAIDAATEALAYYPKQVEKFLKNHESLTDIHKFEQELTQEERIISQEFLFHARELRGKSDLDKISLIKSWGGVKVLYRKSIEQSPSYRLNHEELTHGLAEQIEFMINLSPIEVIKDEFGAASAILCQDNLKIEAKTILIATGTSPNTILATEDPKNFKLEGKYFNMDNDYVSFLGDLHPSYAGSVVKAMASAKNAYPIISDLLSKKKPITSDDFLSDINRKLTAKVHKLIRHSHNILEIIVHAPLAALNFKPGQFYRLQNFEIISGYAMEPLALTGSSVDVEKGLISLIVIEIGSSSKLCSKLKIGEKIILMGPTGTPTDIAPNENVLLIGGGLGNAVLFSIGSAFRALGSKVLYVAGYRSKQDLYKIDEIEKAADHIIWSCQEELLDITREGDYSFCGNVIEAIEQYGAIKDTPIKLSEIDRIIAIGSDGMMNALQEARKSKLAKYLNKTHQAIASINSPMQCMMKEICGQCIQKHVDPATGLESFIYSCNMQDQNMDMVDFAALKNRLSQNSLLEKISRMVLHSS